MDIRHTGRLLGKGILKCYQEIAILSVYIFHYLAFLLNVAYDIILLISRTA